MSATKDQDKGTNDSASGVENALLSLASSLAALFLEKNKKKGNGIEIPSLGIVIEGDEPSIRQKDHPNGNSG
jgi:hypothetical protein